MFDDSYQNGQKIAGTSTGTDRRLGTLRVGAAPHSDAVPTTARFDNRRAVTAIVDNVTYGNLVPTSPLGSANDNALPVPQPTTKMRIKLTGLGRGDAPLRSGALVPGDKPLVAANDPALSTIPIPEFQEVIICFAAGTRIATARGEVAVECLNAGDQIITRDNGVQPLRWVGCRALRSDDLAKTPEHAPVRIRRGALGNGAPEHDVLVSPNHKMLINSQLTGSLFGEREVLVAAKHLTGLDGVDVVPVEAVRYFHLMFDRHEVIFANRCWSESFQPDDPVMAGIQSAQRREILALFPELAAPMGSGKFTAARRSLRDHEALMLTNEQQSRS